MGIGKPKKKNKDKDWVQKTVEALREEAKDPEFPKITINPPGVASSSAAHGMVWSGPVSVRSTRTGMVSTGPVWSTTTRVAPTNPDLVSGRAVLGIIEPADLTDESQTVAGFLNLVLLQLKEHRQMKINLQKLVDPDASYSPDEPPIEKVLKRLVEFFDKHKNIDEMIYDWL